MADLERQLEADKAMRNQAKRLVERDIRVLKGALPPGGVGALVKDEAGHLASMASANKGKLGGVGTAFAAVGLAWAFRHHLIDLFRGSDSAEEDQPGHPDDHVRHDEHTPHTDDFDGASHERPQTR